MDTTKDKLINNHRNQDEFLELLRQDKIPKGLGLGINLDIYLRFKHGSFNICLGHANVGKTYWLLWFLLAHSVKNNLKHLIYSAENTIHGLKRNLIELYMDKRIVDMTKGELEKAKNFIEEHFDFIDSTRLWTIDEFMRNAQSLKGYDTLMIDPHNSFVKPKGVNSHEHDYETASKLRLFSKKTNTSVWLCVHAATEALRKTHKNGEYEGLTMPCQMSDAEGGGKWSNRCDDFIVVHRYVAHPHDWMYTRIEVKKVKETESGGKPTIHEEPVLFRMDYGTRFTCGGINAIQL
jgi:hypothetical protein